MKNFKLFALLIISLGIVTSCNKDTFIDSYSSNSSDNTGTESSSLLGFSDGNTLTNCNSNNSSLPPYKLRLTELGKTRVQAFITGVNNSGTSNWNQKLIDEYGDLNIEISVFSDNGSNSYENLTIPVHKKSNNTITGILQITNVSNNKFEYNFNNRKIHEYYIDHPDQKFKNRPSNTSLNLKNSLYAMFDYAVCNTDVINSLPPLPDEPILETPICVQTAVTFWSWYNPDCYAINENEIELRNGGCWETGVDMSTIEVPCPPVSGGGSGGGGTVGGGGSGGSGGGGSTGGGTNGGSGNGAQAECRAAIAFLDNFLSTDAINNLNQLLTSDNIECMRAPDEIINFLKNNNYSISSKRAAECMARAIEVSPHPSAPDVCTNNGLPAAQMLQRMNDMPPVVFSISSPALADISCRMANSNLTIAQIETLTNLIKDYVDEDVVLGPGGQQINRGQLASDALDLILKNPSIYNNFTQLATNTSFEQATSTLVIYDAYVTEVNGSPTNTYQWEVMLEVFEEELGPLLLEIFPYGIGDMASAYNEYNAGNYWAACASLVAVACPLNEMWKAWDKASDIKKGFKAVAKIYRVWNNLMNLPGGQKVLNKLPQAWKDLPGSKLADGSGLRWVKSNSHHIRIMEPFNSGYPSQQVPYARLFKGHGYLDINGNIVDANSAASHIPLSAITDDLLDNFFN